MKVIWKIVDLERDPETGTIHTAHWRAEAVDGEYSSGSYGSQSIPAAPESVPFTPYDKVTQEDVLSWCFAAGLDKEAIETSFTDQIEEQKKPKVVHGLPWQ